MPIDRKQAEALLAKIREQAATRPLVRIFTGPIEEMKAQSDVSQAANEYVAEWVDDPDNVTPDGISAAQLESEWVEVAEFEHALGWAFTEDDAEAWELERRLVIELAAAGDATYKRLLPHVMATDAFNAFAWHGKWYHYGCQSLDIEEKYAASLCATKVAPSELDYVKLPWPCFAVRVPKFLQPLQINGENLKVVIVNLVKYDGPVKVTGRQQLEGHTTMERYQLHLVTANKYRILPTNSLAQWADPNPANAYDEIRLVQVEHSEIDRRQLEVIGRLVLGAVISMNDPKNVRRYGTITKDPSLGSPRFGTNNQVVLHKIGRPVKVDARETIGAYATGRVSRSPNVRTLVAGHWKNQPHGPKSSLRRWQHVECYWRGDEVAPLIVRPHVLTGGG